MIDIQEIGLNTIIPSDVVGMVFMQPFAKFPDQIPRWVGTEKDRQLSNLTRCLEIATKCDHGCNLTQFTVLPEYSLPGLDGVKVVEEAIADSLLEIIKKDFKNEVPPSRDTIIKLISKARNTKHSILDEPWHLGLLGKFREQEVPYFNADAVDAILKVQYWCGSQAAENYRKASLGKKAQIKNGLTMLYPVLSIRQAKWVAVLHRFIGDDLSWLWMASFQYSYQEIISDISNTDFDASLLDNALYSGKRAFLFHMRQHSIIDKYNFGDKYDKALSLMQNATKTEDAKQLDARNEAIKHLRATGGKLRMLIDKDGNPIDKIVQLDLSPEELQQGDNK